MTAPDPRLGEIEGLESRLRRAHRMSCSDPTDPTRTTTYSESADSLAYLLAELRKAQDALGRVEGLCDAAAKRGIESGPPLELTALRAAVAAATGGDRG